MAFVRAIVLAYARAGIDAAQALDAAQITPRLLKQVGGKVTAAQFETLSAHAMRELDDEALGWFSRRLPWGSYGMLARASLGAPNLRVALARWCRHHGLLTGDVTLRVDVTSGKNGDENVATLLIEEHRDLSYLRDVGDLRGVSGVGGVRDLNSVSGMDDLSSMHATDAAHASNAMHDGSAASEMRELCHVTLLRNALGLASWFIDSRIALQRAHFAFASPPHAAVYRTVLFPAPRVSFGEARTEVSFAAAYLEQPLRRDEPALRHMLRSRALSLIVLPHRRDRLLVQQVRKLLTADLTAPHSAESLAEQLNLSARTLHRQLKDEGASLQQLKDEARCDKAKDLLLRTNKPIKQIAAATGFRNEKSFIRAFKGWVGIGPAAIRKKHLSTSGGPSSNRPYPSQKHSQG